MTVRRSMLFLPGNTPNIISFFIIFFLVTEKKHQKTTKTRVFRGFYGAGRET